MKKLILISMLLLMAGIANAGDYYCVPAIGIHTQGELNCVPIPFEIRELGGAKMKCFDFTKTLKGCWVCQPLIKDEVILEDKHESGQSQFNQYVPVSGLWSNKMLGVTDK